MASTRPAQKATKSVPLEIVSVKSDSMPTLTAFVLEVNIILREFKLVCLSYEKPSKRTKVLTIFFFSLK